MKKILFVLLGLCLWNPYAFAGGSIYDEFSKGMKSNPYNVCTYNGGADNIGDRFLAGQIFAYRLENEFVRQTYPNIYAASKIYSQNCGWGFYFKVKGDNITGGTNYSGGFIIRF